MDVDVGDPVEPIVGSAPPPGPRSSASDHRGAHGELRLQIGWRWIPDPDESDASVPTGEEEGGLRSAVLRALAWASLR